MTNRSSLAAYNVYGDLTDAHVEGDTIVLRISKRNNPHLSAGELRRDFVGWQVTVSIYKTKKLDAQSTLC